MCVVSMIMDHYYDKWSPWRQPPYQVPPQQPAYPMPVPTPVPYPVPVPSPISAEEVEEFRKLLERAREYDRRNHEPDCELDEKRQRLKQLADELGVKIDFV